MPLLGCVEVFLFYVLLSIVYLLRNYFIFIHTTIGPSLLQDSAFANDGFFLQFKNRMFPISL